jgi:C-terminal processing protease CtpA/Prc
MKIRSDPNIRGVRVSDMTVGGAARQSGRIFIGDVILKINGIEMLDASHHTVVRALTANNDVELTLAPPDPEQIVPDTPAIQRRTVKLNREGYSNFGLRIKVSSLSDS